MIQLKRRGFLWRATAAVLGAGVAFRLEAKLGGRLKARKSPWPTLYLLVEHEDRTPFLFKGELVTAALIIPSAAEEKRFLGAGLLAVRVRSTAHEVRKFLTDRNLDPAGLWLRPIEQSDYAGEPSREVQLAIAAVADGVRL